MKYFAYGTNVKKEQMDIRCSSGKILLNGKLGGYKLIFNSRGVTTIVPSTNREVYGVLYEIEPSRGMSLLTITHYQIEILAE